MDYEEGQQIGGTAAKLTVMTTMKMTVATTMTTMRMAMSTGKAMTTVTTTTAMTMIMMVRMRMRMIDGAQFLPGVQFPNTYRAWGYVQYSSCVFLPGNME